MTEQEILDRLKELKVIIDETFKDIDRANYRFKRAETLKEKKSINKELKVYNAQIKRANKETAKLTKLLKKL